MDGDKLRERAAETWAQCKKLGLDTTFFLNHYEKKLHT